MRCYQYYTSFVRRRQSLRSTVVQRQGGDCGSIARNDALMMMLPSLRA
ncbi:MAG: hypothetical protein LBV31_03685 [Prevotellaceae bacterium]|nr:hypothetical protein [Prevotellaceae bacterium]